LQNSESIFSGIGIRAIKLRATSSYRQLKVCLLEEKQLLKEQQQPANNCCYSSNLKSPEELPSVEEALKTTTAVVKVLDLGFAFKRRRQKKQFFFFWHGARDCSENW
jgi:hypothetical protein